MMQKYTFYVLIPVCLLLGNTLCDETLNTSVKNADILNRLEKLEKLVLDQNTVIRQLQEENKVQDEVIQKQQSKIMTLELAQEDVHGPPDTDTAEHHVDQVDTPDIKDIDNNYSEMIPRKRLLLVETPGPIAFHARIDKGAIEHIGITQKLVFDITVLNNGNGYLNSSGIFTAPVSGLYFLSLSVCILHSGKDIHAEIMKNGVNIAGSYANGNDQGSISVVVPLVASDEIWVSSLHHPDTYLWGDTLTSFSGFMISEF